MPVARFEMPDGRIARFEVPEGTTPEQAQAMISQSLNQPKRETYAAKDMLGGTVRSGMGVVSNLMRPLEALIPGGNDFDSGHKERMGRVDTRFRAQGYDPESLAFQGTKLLGDVAITTPVGGALAKLVPYIPGLAKAVPALPAALRSGGFQLGKPAATTATGKAVDWALRTAGGATTGAVSAGMLNADDAATGGLLGGAMPAAFKAGGEAGLLVSDKVIKPAARRLMQSSIKPTIEQLRKGDAAVAVQTLIDYGLSPTQKGVEQLRATIDDINRSIAEKLKGSNASVSRDDVLGYLGDVRGKFGSQVNPVDDLTAIQRTGDEFANHPYFQKVEAKGPALEEALQRATLGKAQALQAAGKLKTFAAQQENLAHGGGVRLAPNQPQNQLYMNSGATGRNALSSSAYPTPLAPRVPGRYTPNIDRVPEGASGYDDAMAAYAARRADEEAAQVALQNWQQSRGMISVQDAQKMKQATYKALKGKYGEVGSASTEAQKALARGLKDKIAEVVPGVGALNAEEARLLKTLSVTERRALMELNKNPVGLSALASSPAGFAAFMADRSAAFKALAARAVNQAAKAPAFLPQAADAFSNPLLRSGVLASESNRIGQQ